MAIKIVSVVAAVVLMLGVSTQAGRLLISGPTAAEHCTCEPYAETRTPDEICNTMLADGTLCNLGGHFPVLGGDCSQYFRCVAAQVGGKAVVQSCPAGTAWDVAFNTCVHKELVIDGKAVCTNKCTGFLYKPLDGCYNVQSTNSGTNAWGLFNSGENAVGCGNTGTATAGVESAGMWAAGCGNSGTAAWGRDVSGSGACGTSISKENELTP